MSRFDYEASKKIMLEDPPFDALIMAAMRKADSKNVRGLKAIFPYIWDELQERYYAPGGYLPNERIENQT